MKKLLTFKVKNYNVGLDFSLVNEIINPIKITKVPTLLPYVKGLINNRGKIYTLIDLSHKFSTQNIEPSQVKCYVLLDEVAIMLDNTPDTANIDETKIQSDGVLKSSNIEGIVLDKNEQPIMILSPDFITNINLTDKYDLSSNSNV